MKSKRILITTLVTVMVVLLVAKLSIEGGFTTSQLFRELDVLADVILAFSTVIYVLLTGFLIFVGKKTFDEANRPYVVFSLETPKGSVIDLVVKNVGNRPAEDVIISTNPKLQSQQEPLRAYHEKQLEYSFLPPNYEHRIAFDIVRRTAGSDVPTTYDVVVKYRYRNNSYTEEYHIDLTPFINKTEIKPEGVDTKILKQLSGINNRLAEIVHRIRANDNIHNNG